MAHRTFQEGGPDGRSVLGMLAVQVERDPKTGAAVVRSVAPVSAPDGAPRDAGAAAVFDDGRKSIHAVGGSGGQPSAEELGQILSAIDGVGMMALLEEVAAAPSEAEGKRDDADAGRTPGRETVPPPLPHHATPYDVRSDGYDDPRAAPSTEGLAASAGNGNREATGITAIGDTAGKLESVVDQRLEEGPVTLVFLGYTDATDGEEGDGGALTVERVLITEDGEERVLGPHTPAVPPPPAEFTEQEAGKESQREAFQDVPLHGDAAGGEGGDGGRGRASPPDVAAAAAGGKGGAETKTCRCCSVM